MCLVSLRDGEEGHRRLDMKLFPVLWISLLILWSSHTETEAEDTDICEDDTLESSELRAHSSSVKGDHVERSAVNDKNFLCLLFPTKELNCSWSFPKLQEGAQLSVAVSICDVNTTDHPNQFSEGRVGSVSANVTPHEMLNVFLQFNITLQDKWTIYVHKYDMAMLEVLSPPQNISASFKDGGLLVTWSKPYSISDPHESCFQYQLDVGDQGGLKNVPNGKMSHMELIADPSQVYSVRVRARHDSNECMGNSQWSEWSHTIILEQTDKLSLLVIISISLGIPMILLALLLLVRHQRVYEVLFPPIPRPPQKYKGFLEKSETFSVFHPAASAELVEEITEVEDATQD